MFTANFGNLFAKAPASLAIFNTASGAPYRASGHRDGTERLPH
jgi:hypothetical protein